ncbi:hypothetical protein KXR53_14370 [Inquilinus limosus]|uniref:hypothetical protein n=1 Tax=Inquilinus limosus TaxID=171674 RepID=UPI003F177F96
MSTKLAIIAAAVVAGVVAGVVGAAVYIGGSSWLASREAAQEKARQAALYEATHCTYNPTNRTQADDCFSSAARFITHGTETGIKLAEFQLQWGLRYRGETTWKPEQIGRLSVAIAKAKYPSIRIDSFDPVRLAVRWTMTKTATDETCTTKPTSEAQALACFAAARQLADTAKADPAPIARERTASARAKLDFATGFGRPASALGLPDDFLVRLVGDLNQIETGRR